MDCAYEVLAFNGDTPTWCVGFHSNAEAIRFAREAVFDRRNQLTAIILIEDDGTKLMEWNRKQDNTILELLF